MRQPNAAHLYNPSWTALQVLLMPGGAAQTETTVLPDSGWGEGPGDFPAPKSRTVARNRTQLGSCPEIAQTPGIRRQHAKSFHCIPGWNPYGTDVSHANSPRFQNRGRGRMRRTHPSGQPADGAGDQVRASGPRRHSPQLPELAEAGQISRARMSQIMHLFDLAPEIQEELLFLPKTTTGADRYTEKQLRQVARSIDWDWQKR